MVTPAERFKGWIDSLADYWKDRLSGWMVSWFAKGGTKLLEDFEPAAIDSVKDILLKVRDDPNTPDELKALINKVITPGNPIVVVLGVLLLVGMMSGTLSALFLPLNKVTSYKVDRGVESFRLDPLTITKAWLRNKPGYDWLWDDLAELGWSDDKIAVAKELAHIIPPLADMVRFADFSSFDPVVIAKWREFYDAPSWISEPFSLLGVTNEAPKDWANKYWFSHWRQPGRYELGDMYRRGLLGTPLIGGEEIGQPGEPGEAEETIKLAYKTMGYSAFWQDSLLELVREIPTRVDVRRWWDMRTIDETELRSIYQRQGYFGKDLENYVEWTKVYVALPDIVARMKNGWVTPEAAKEQLLALFTDKARGQELWETKVRPEGAAIVEEERQLTITDITMWLKKYPDKMEEGIELIMDLGYSRADAEFKIAARVAALSGSPETYAEWKDLTTKWRIATGKEATPMPEELKRAADEVVKVTKEVASLEEAIKLEEDKLIAAEVLPEEATVQVTELRVTLHRAEAELQRVKQEYDRQVAEWKHGLP